MAKRKTKKKTGGSRRRGRVSGIGVSKDTGMEIVGAALSSVVSKLMTRNMTNANPKILSGVQIVAGMFAMRQRQPLLRGIGYGLLSQGASSLATNVGLISGIEESLAGVGGGDYDDGMGAYQYELMSGISNDAQVAGGMGMAGMSNNSILSGAEDGGYNMNPGMLGL